jgi:hypothetical protein
MESLELQLDGDGCWKDLQAKQINGKLELGVLVGMALLKNGTPNGNHTVTMRIEMPDGRTVTCETTLTLLRTATLALVTRAKTQGQSFDDHPSL